MNATRAARAVLLACAVGATGCRARDSGASRTSDSAQVARGAAPDSAGVSGADTISLPDAGGVNGGAAATFLSGEELARAGDQLARGSTTARTVESRSSHSLVEARRVHDGEPEVHDCWADVAIVQAGHATLLTGGRVAGSRVTGAGEHRGGTISGGSRRAVASADVVVIPAGVPHQYLVAAGDSVRYLTVKVREPDASCRR